MWLQLTSSSSKVSAADHASFALHGFGAPGAPGTWSVCYDFVAMNIPMAMARASLRRRPKRERFFSVFTKNVSA